MEINLRAGGQVHCAVYFTKDGVLTDPTTVTFKWRIGAGAVTTYVYPAAQVVKDSPGIYHVDLPVNTAGMYYVGFYATGTVVAVDEDSFNVLPSLMA